MHVLKKLQFIDIQSGKNGAISHVLLWNPHKAIRWHRQQKTPGLVEANYNALLGRALDIGANDMLEDPPQTAAPVNPVPVAPPVGSETAAG
jgi:hypothetical protein